jgi:cytochrome b561
MAGTILANTILAGTILECLQISGRGTTRPVVKNSQSNWGLVARGFHWTLGVLIIGMLAYGYWMNHWALRPDRPFHRSIHADIGYIIIFLTGLRLIWRAISATPKPLDGTPRWERGLAHLNHALLYLWTLIVAFLGWAHSGARRTPYSDFFGLFHVPQFTSENRELALVYEERHIQMAYVLLALIAIHVLVALWHHFIKRDRVLARMVSGN